MDSVIKAAKKILKKSSDPLNLKDVLKKVAKKTDGKATSDEIEKWINGSDKFTIDGKTISLSKSKKRKSDDVDDKAAKKAAKKAKKEAKKKKKASSDSSSAGEMTETSVSTSGDSLTLVDCEKWRKENKVVLKATTDDEEGNKLSEALKKNEAYVPYNNFTSDRIKKCVHEAFLKQCKKNGFTSPSPIQAQCWPVLLNPGSDGKRRDIVGIAETGSGKTLGFSVPALTALANESVAGKKRRTPRMLVLSPTRELAMQSHVVIEEFGSLVNLKSMCVFGGVPKYQQVNDLKKGMDCVVATPGRIKDLINDGACDLSRVSQLVLDEADRMLDMGFEEDVRYIISQCMDKENGRQTAMFSATWPAAIQQIALEYMVNPVRVYVGFEAIVGSNGEGVMDDSLSANKRVTQNVEVIEDRAREARLRSLLQKYAKKHSKKSPYRVLIFALYKKEAARLEGNLARAGYSGLVTSIHGDKSQDARTQALQQFKDGVCPLLVATDVAARGLDIPNVELVINYTFPLTIEDYVHRIGRTGRAGKTGISFTFFQPGDKGHAGELQQVMKQAGQTPPEALMKFGSTIKKKEHKLYGNFGPRGGGPMKKAVKITFDSDSE